MLACGPAGFDFIFMLFLPLLLPIGAALVAVALVTAGSYCFRSARENKLRRRLNAGQCEKCGYDLRASPCRCPECGTVRRGRAWNVAAWV
jgi:hypothetical protein